jgi:hypothetical protein
MFDLGGVQFVVCASASYVTIRRVLDRAHPMRRKVLDCVYRRNLGTNLSDLSDFVPYALDLAAL